jgi:hypothetical protein
MLNCFFYRKRKQTNSSLGSLLATRLALTVINDK